MAYKGLFSDIKTGFGSLETALAKSVTDTKNLGKVWMDTGKSIADSLLKTLIGAALKPLEAEILRLMAQWGLMASAQKTAAATEYATQVAVDDATIASEAFVAGAVAYAPLAWNPPLAAAASAEAIGAVMALMAGGSAEGGADLLGMPSMLMQTHPDEMVLPKDESNVIRQLPDMASALQGAGSGGPSVSFDGFFRGAQFYGVPNQSFVSAFGEQMKSMLRAAGVYTQKF